VSKIVDGGNQPMPRKVGVEFADLGEQTLKNIARPVRTYAVVWDEHDPASQAENAE